ncbi:matrixin family metalloprotease [Hymenobacter chitinivorans]|uniref:Putative secreted protein (Por secretion system target) n=1 Tax=Hymenobacter chitinivorans DSM 11115 TaxID=1121954 RepID=A0A2M9B5D8_9BACT|nr:matrixin family metalloprotease [Hymenobacter chitinivorans]PJJ53162.1 putative secreted protein (Por secretion system target) [Hymenobacter chitinivorans DSM 11115]
MKLWSTLRRFAAGLLVLSCLPATPGRAQVQEPDGHCLLVPVAPAERARRAALVVEAEVLDARGFWDTRHQRIYTAHQLRVFSVLKGTAPAQLTIVTEGGRVALDEQRLTNTLQLQPGDQGVFFLTSAGFATTVPASWTPYASEQGFIRYQLTDASAAEPFRHYPLIGAGFYDELAASLGQPRRVIQPNEALQQAQQRRTQPVVAAKGQAPVVSTLSPTVVPAGVEGVLTISGSGFGATQGTGRVEFRNADDGGASLVQAQPSDYLSWTDTQIRVRVPSYSPTGSPAGSGPVRVTTGASLQATSGASVIVPYAATNVQVQGAATIVRPNHINQNGEGGYTFRFEPGFAANQPAAAAFSRALETGWRCQTGINWTVGAVRTTTTTGTDGENSVGFDNGSELPASVLGRTTSYYKGCIGSNGSISFQVSEIDMQFDDGVAWQFGPALPTTQQFDFETVVLHELGHAQQLGHVITNTAVMYFGVSRGRSNRTLTANDKTGAQLVLRTRSFPTAGCGPSPMLPAPLTKVAATFVSGSGTEVTWTTRAECLVSSFVVERAADTTAWQPVATVAAGAANNSYRVVDAQPLPGLSYYRLRVRRPDGSLDNVAPRLVQDGSGSRSALQIFPNPVTGTQLQFLFTGTAEGILSLFIYDAVGRRYQPQGISSRAGTNVTSISVASLHPGWYVLRWRDSNGNSGTTNFVKIN